MKKLSIAYLLISCIFILGCEGLFQGYNKKDNKVYYKHLSETTGTGEILVDDADYKSFKKLKDFRFGKDKNWVFFNGQILKGADSESFILLKEYTSFGFYQYAKDKNSVFVNGNSLAGADPTTFEPININYSKDTKNIYFLGERFTSNSQSFELIDQYYSMDKNDIYLNGVPLKVCSFKDFEFVFENSTNNEDVWIENASDRWARDGCHYYFGAIKIPSEDYKNIKVFKGSMGIVKDSKSVFYKERNILFNPEGEKILDTIDIETFTCERFLKCKDKFGPINVFCGRTTCDGKPITD